MLQDENHPLFCILPFTSILSLRRIIVSKYYSGWKGPQESTHPAQSMAAFEVRSVYWGFSSAMFYMCPRMERTCILNHIIHKMFPDLTGAHLGGFSNLRQSNIFFWSSVVTYLSQLTFVIVLVFSMMNTRTMVVVFGCINIDMCHLRCPRVFLSASNSRFQKNVPASCISCILLVSSWRMS